MLQHALQSDAFANNIFKARLGIELLAEVGLLALDALQRRLRLSLFREVANYADYDPAFLGFHRSQHDVHWEFTPILAATNKRKPSAHRANLRNAQISIAMIWMPAAKSFRDQNFNRLALQFLLGVVKQA